MMLADRNIDIKEVVKRWNDGEIVWSVELGGIGPGYEQAIQISIFRILTYWLKKKIKPESLVKDGKFILEIDKPLHKILNNLGLSGAQAGVAKSTAYPFLKYGYKEMMDKAPRDRLIQVSKRFPG